MSDAKYTPFNAMVDIVAAPGRALDAVKPHTSWLWWPLLISVLLTCAAFTYYFSWVDFDWLVDETIAGLPAENRAEAADGVRAFMTPTMSTVTTCLAIVIITFVIYCIQAAYLHVATKLATSAEVRYGQWFNFSAWTAFVNVIGAIAIFMVIFLADNNRLGQDELSPFSMNSLFIHARMGDPWFNWGNSLSLVNIWILFLMSMGYARWTGSSIIKSTVIAVLPWALIFGVWAVLI